MGSRPDREIALQPRRRQCLSGGIGSDDSSDSESGGTFSGEAGSGIRTTPTLEMGSVEGLDMIMGVNRGFGIAISVACSRGFSAGV